MSVAVQLAKRDLKKQHEQEELEQSRKQNSEKGVGKKGKAKILQSREYREKKKKRQNRDPQEKVLTLNALIMLVYGWQISTFSLTLTARGSTLVVRI